MAERIVRTEKTVRGPFGQVCKWTFIVFNILMLVFMFSAFASVGSVANNATSEAERAGVGIGATLGLGFILTIWALGDVILGMFVLFTKGKKIITEERVAV